MQDAEKALLIPGTKDCRYAVKDISQLNPHNYPTNSTIDCNLTTLFDRLMELQGAVGYDLVINSGLRDQAQQNALIDAGKTNAVHSKHLAGAAADIADPDGSLAQWTKDNLTMMATIGFWMESFDHTNGWVHYQILPPGSGNRIFIP